MLQLNRGRHSNRFLYAVSKIVELCGVCGYKSAVSLVVTLAAGPSFYLLNRCTFQ